MSSRTLSLGVVAALLAGCASQQPFVHPLSMADARSLRQPAIYLAIPQKTLEAQYSWGSPQPGPVVYAPPATPPNMPTPSVGDMLVGGLVAGLVVYGIQEHEKHSIIDETRKYLVPVQRSLKGFDPRDSIQQDLMASFRQQPWATTSVLHSVTKLPRNDAGNGDTAQIYVDYALSPSFSELVMRVEVAIRRQTQTKNGNSHTLVYRNRLIYLSSPAPLPPKTLKDKQRIYARVMAHWDGKAMDAEVAKLNREGANVSNSAERQRVQEEVHAHNVAVRAAWSNLWSYDEAMRFRMDYWAANHAKAVKQAVSLGIRTIATLLAENLRTGSPGQTAAAPAAGKPALANDLTTLPDSEIVTETPYGLVAHGPKSKVTPFIWANPVTP